MSTEERPPSWVINPEIPSVARMYDYYLGGKDNFAADRRAGDRAVEAVPYVAEFVRANRRFLSHAVTLMARRGVRQFIDIGSGLPTQENVHQVAQRVVPDARVVYVDNDPIVLVHGRALLAGDPFTTVVQGDLREPQAVLDHREVAAQIDFDRPVGLLMLAILHFVHDEDGPARIVEQLRKRLASGSFVALSHGHAGRISPEAESQVRSAYGGTAAGDIVPRTPEQIMAFLDGTELLGPGLVPVEAWTPDTEPFTPDLAKAGFLAAVGRIP
ncbi:SAM-dependent methyltransferase [Actinocorallia populi]|uniref:SAM-dependent methyltransferase n=1 Tax=Actinocorallia populi TaxID=2079200 RepID=UPI000D08D4E5|nr:SAM-dependent methyltransferase [Actinocorallia populi]